MRGSIAVPFSALFADSLQRHGMAFCAAYCLKRGMSRAEFRLWCRITFKVTA